MLKFNVIFSACVCINKKFGAYLHHKWCVHSILPLGPRVKQPTFHKHTYKISDCKEYM